MEDLKDVAKFLDYKKQYTSENKSYEDCVDEYLRVKDKLPTKEQEDAAWASLYESRVKRTKQFDSDLSAYKKLPFFKRLIVGKPDYRNYQ